MGVDGADGRGRSAQLPVGRPSSSVGHRNREATGPARQAREFPASDECLPNAADASCERLAFAEGEFDDPVRINLMGSIEIRNRTQVSWGPRVDNLPPESAPGIDALRMGGEVD